MRYTTKGWHAATKYGKFEVKYAGSMADIAHTTIKKTRSRAEQWWILRRVFEAFPDALADEHEPLMRAFAANQEPETIQQLRDEFLAVAYRRCGKSEIDRIVINAETMVTLHFR